AISEMLQNKYTLFSPTKLIGLATKGIPKVVENRVDAKQEVDKELKHVCEEFILDNSKLAIEPLSSFLLKVSAFRLRNDLREVHHQTSLKNQKFAQPDKVIEVYETFQETVKARLLYIVPKMSEYLGDRETESILLKPIQASAKHIIDTYQAFYDIMKNENFDLNNFPKSLGDIDKVKGWVQCEWVWEEQEHGK
ncbi:6616_t:CDS:2, partial [Acaulospora morrowiae]